MEKHSCKDYSDLIFEYSEGGLSAEERNKLELHFSECESCSEKLKEANAVLSYIKSAGYSAPPELISSVMNAVKEETAIRSRVNRKKRRLISRIVPAAASVVVAFGVVLSIVVMNNEVKEASDGVPSGYGKDESATLNVGEMITPENAIDGEWSWTESKASAFDRSESCLMTDINNSDCFSEPEAEAPVKGLDEEKQEESFDAALMIRGGAYVAENISDING